MRKMAQNRLQISYLRDKDTCYTQLTYGNFNTILKVYGIPQFAIDWLAERGGFEPPRGVNPNTLSRRAP